MRVSAVEDFGRELPGEVADFGVGGITLEAGTRAFLATLMRLSTAVMGTVSNASRRFLVNNAG